MEIAIRDKGKVDVLDLMGSLAAGGDEALRKTVVERLDAERRLFLFNMLEVPYIDSVGLGETVACTKRICDRGGSVKLVMRGQGKVHEVFEITGLDRAYEIFDDVEVALASWIR